MRDPLRIWGLGSEHGDDRIGWAVTDSLAEDPDCRRWTRTARTPWDLLLDDPWPRRMIVVDAAELGRAAGSIVETSLGGDAGMSTPANDQATHDSSATSLMLRASRGSSHGAGLGEILQLARRLGRSVEELVLLLVEVKQCDPGTGLSDPARIAVPRVVRRVRELAVEWTRHDIR